MRNIFEGLSRYPPTVKNIPEENQLTESFAFVMDQNPSLLSYLLKELLQENSSLLKKLKSKNIITVETQNTTYSHFSYGVHDMVIRSENPDLLFIVENKKSSPIDINQLNKYLKDIKNFEKEWEGAKGFLILVTPYREDEDSLNKINEDSSFTHIHWSEIYRIIDEYKDEHYKSVSSDNKDKFILEQFLGYMEVLGLTVDFNKADFEAFVEGEDKYNERYNAKTKLKFLIDEVWEGLPKRLKNRMKYHDVGNMSEWGCWGYISEKEKQSRYPHFSMSMGRNGMYVGIRLETNNASRMFYNALKEDKENSYKNFLKASESIIKITEELEGHNNYFIELEKQASDLPQMAGADVINDCKLYFKYLDEEVADYLFNRMKKLFDIKEATFNSISMWIPQDYEGTLFYGKDHWDHDDLVEDVIETILNLEPLYNFIWGREK